MKSKTVSLIVLCAFSLSSSLVYAQTWDKQCLDDCFSTGHDCNFCAYQCTAREYPAPPYTGHLPCPLNGPSY